MNRKEIADLLPIIQAFAAGEAIEGKLKPCTIRGIESNNDWRKMDEILFSNNWVYRIKPKPGYRPFANAEECLREMEKHQPFGWVKGKGSFFLIIYIEDKLIGYGSACGVILHSKFSDILKCFTFVDDTPFGVKEE